AARLKNEFSRRSTDGLEVGTFSPAVLDPVAHAAWNRQQPVEVEIDPRSCFLRDLVLDGQVEVVGTELEGTKGTLVHGQHGSPHVLDIVQEDSRQRDVT